MTRWGVAAFVVLAISATSSCGQKEDLGKEIGISVTPDTVEIIGGTGPSCVDKVQAKTSGETMQRSVGASRVQFSNFKLEWRGIYPLTVYDIEVRVESSALEETFKTNLSSDEIEALLASPGGVVIPGADPAAKQYNEINSNDPNETNRKTTAPYAACGLAVGGLTITDTTPSFTAKVTIIVKGYAENATTNEVTSVEQRTTAKAKFVRSF